MCHSTPSDRACAGCNLLLLLAVCVLMRMTQCRLRPQEEWLGEMVIRLHEAKSGSLSPEDDGSAAEE